MKSDKGKKASFEPLEHSVYFGRQRLGHYVRISNKAYAAYDTFGRSLGKFKNRKKAWGAISKAAYAGRSAKLQAASARRRSREKNAVPRRNCILGQQPLPTNGSEP